MGGDQAPAEIKIVRTRSRVLASPPGGQRANFLRRFFSRAGVHPYDEIGWRVIELPIRDPNGTTELRQLEFPESWSDNAANIAGSKYFRGQIGSTERETSVRQMIGRVTSALTDWGLKFGHLKTAEEAEIFSSELTSILLNQRAAFNSPVWFNVGFMEKPQCSACFILSVEDNMESILEWVKNEGLIFKRGSGAGINLSALRAESETLSHGGRSSGPVSFMRGADSVAGMIASGGATRRAAKMVVLNIDHPDVMKFIRTKAEEEKKVRALIDAGFNMYDLNDPGWSSIQYQNANNSVRVTDEFMEAVETNGKFQTCFVRTGEPAQICEARELMREIARAAWECGDPGLQYDTTINRWHTCPNSGRINASNPCSEYMHLDDSACNLASINLLKYLKPDGTFDVEAFRHTVDIMILAQEIIVDGSSYPTEKITQNAHNFRELGLGYANLGALLMVWGLPYDSPVACHTAGAITALMTGEAYRFSALMAERLGPFGGYKINREPMLKVIETHERALGNINSSRVNDPKIHAAAERAWSEAFRLAKRHGLRNSQATVLAPTGTIALMMDCATTGIEPEFALVKHKKLVGGGLMKFVNSAVPLALKRLGYADEEIMPMLSHIEMSGTIEGAPGLKEEHLAVFDCAIKPPAGARAISWRGHVKMVAAAQPFISGAISKTFNMPAETTAEEIMQAYIMGWKLGLKAFAVYRDGSKAAQPLYVEGQKPGRKKDQPIRRRLPPTRQSETHKFSIAGHEGYLTYSMYEDGRLAELFIRMSKQGSTLAGLLDAFATGISIALQYGVPLKTFVEKFAHSRYEPAGYTENPDIRVVTSITDYIFRYLALRFLKDSELDDFGIKTMPKELEGKKANGNTVVYADSVCKICGSMMIQTGTCKTCIQCGTSNGGC